MKKIKILLLIILLGIVAWNLSGGISASREKIVPKTLWNAISSNSQNSADSDKDGLSDEEEKKLGTDPNKADTDGDGFLDGQEVKDGYDPLKPPPGDKRPVNANSNANSNSNVNSNSNSNTNSQTQNSNGNNNNSQNNTNANQTNQNTQQAPVSNNSSKDNVTEQVALKVDDLIARYQLYSSPYNSLNEDTRAEIEKELNGFTEGIVNNTGLNFAFNIPEDSLKVIETETGEKDQYLSRAKNILREHNFLADNQTIEEGLGQILLNLSDMSKKDIEWDKINNWKKETDVAYKELLEMPVNPHFKSAHIRLLRVVRSLGIVFDNVNEGDYFRSFLAAGRADKINSELNKFSEEIKKTP